MTTPLLETDILIVGAGLCGLMAATTLTAENPNVSSITIVDKGRSVGGRLATRRIGPGRADHGAQFMTVRRPPFQKYVDEWLARGLVYKWSDGWGPNFDGYPRYAVRDGFNSLGKALAADLQEKGVDIQVGVRLNKIATDGTQWQATDEVGNEYQAGTVILTPPVPQSLALLNAGEVALNNQDQTVLEGLAYAPCLCGLFWIEGEVYFEEPGAALEPDAVVSWMADNQRKGISPDATLITIHSGPEYSQANYDAPPEEVLPTLFNSLRPYLKSEVTIREEQLKRWRYAKPMQLHSERFLKAQELPPLYFGGDIFGEPRVEGASLSGITIGREILQCHQRK
ncbi:MAG: FAD-dependent oxidoreductase [Chloroflexota bacterium]